MLVPISSIGKASSESLVKESAESGGVATPVDLKVRGISVMENASSKAAASAVLEDGDGKIVMSVSVASSGSITQFVPASSSDGEDFILAKTSLTVKRTGECNVTVYIDQ